MKKKQQTFKQVEGSLEIENLSYNPLSQMLIVKTRAEPKVKKAHLELYENYYGVPEEIWFELIESPDKDTAQFLEERIKPIYKHKKEE